MGERNYEYGAHKYKDLPITAETTSLLVDPSCQFDIVPFIEEHATTLQGTNLWGVIQGSAFDDKERRIITGHIILPFGKLQNSEGGAKYIASVYQKRLRFEDALQKDGYACRWYKLLVDPVIDTNHPWWRIPSWEKFPGIW